MYSDQYDDEMLAQANEDIVFDMRADLIKAEQRIAELEAQLAAVLSTLEAAMVNDGQLYAEGCKP